MHTQHVNSTASESSKTCLKGQKICVSAEDLRIRWVSLGAEGESAAFETGIHYPVRNGNYGADVLLLYEAEVLMLIAADTYALSRLASSAREMTARYDAGDILEERYIIPSCDQIVCRTGFWSVAAQNYLRRASGVVSEEVQKFMDALYAALEAGLDLYQASDVARGFNTPEKALSP